MTQPENCSFWAKNIRFLRRKHKLSQDQLAEKLKISRSKLNAHENGQTRNPVVEDLRAVSEIFRISIDNLLRQDLSQLSEIKFQELLAGNDNFVTGSELRVLATTVSEHGEEFIEFVPHQARAGYLSGFSDPGFIESLPVFSLPHLPRGRKYRMFPTTGDSMFPIPENAYVIGNYIENWRELKPDTPSIVVTRTEGIVFKLATMQAEPPGFLLRSLNSVYPPFVVAAHEVLEVWKFVSYISDSIPAPEIPVKDMARTLKEIHSDIRELLSKER